MKGKSRPSRLVVLSVDGMRPDFYRRPKEFGLKIPNLLELVKCGGQRGRRGECLSDDNLSGPCNPRDGRASECAWNL